MRVGVQEGSSMPPQRDRVASRTAEGTGRGARVFTALAILRHTRPLIAAKAVCEALSAKRRTRFSLGDGSRTPAAAERRVMALAVSFILNDCCLLAKMRRRRAIPTKEMTKGKDKGDWFVWFVLLDFAVM